MKMDYLMMTENGMVLVEENENREQENHERFRSYAKETVAGSREAAEQERKPE